ncbi:uncharacterized protein [Branchiostoma lanceolatum]|uniref:uncharacterized protein n=1 Tax=Branchiostoma lanceolatum TaxID=7740 RepID=UPI003452D2D8
MRRILVLALLCGLLLRVSGLRCWECRSRGEHTRCEYQPGLVARTTQCTDREKRCLTSKAKSNGHVTVVRGCATPARCILSDCDGVTGNCSNQQYCCAFDMCNDEFSATVTMETTTVTTLQENDQTIADVTSDPGPEKAPVKIGVVRSAGQRVLREVGLIVACCCILLMTPW